MTPSRHLPAACLAAFLHTLLLAYAPPAATAEPAAAERVVELRSFNRDYRDLDSDLAPIRQGALTIHVSSPEHRLSVLANQLRLVPRADSVVEIHAAVEFEGEGRLIADVEGAGPVERFVDDVEAPRQTAHAAAAVRLERVIGGYLMTIVEPLDASVALRIESRLVGQLVGICRALSLIPFVGVGCDGLDAALRRVNVPMPATGEVFFFAADHLDETDRAVLDAYATAPAID